MLRFERRTRFPVEKMPAKFIVGEYDGMQTEPRVRFRGLADGFELRGVRAHALMHEARVQTA